MDKTLLVIGNGVWGTKLRTLFQSWGFEVNQFGARSFLQLDLERKRDIFNIDIIWIATTPELQIKIISSISKCHSNSIFILEKPFFRDLNEKFQFFEVVKESNLNLRSSSPWVYSDIWLKSKNKLLDLFGPLQISIMRSGPSNNKSILPYLDWLSHDVQLISDLFNSEAKIIYLDRSNHKFKSDSNNIKIGFKDGSSLDLSGGLSKSKISSWVARDKKDNCIRIDFNSKSFQHFGHNQILIESYKSPPNDNPLLDMIQNFTNLPNYEKAESHFRWQEILI